MGWVLLSPNICTHMTDRHAPRKVVVINHGIAHKGDRNVPLRRGLKERGQADHKDQNSTKHSIGSPQGERNAPHSPQHGGTTVCAVVVGARLVVVNGCTSSDKDRSSIGTDKVRSVVLTINHRAMKRTAPFPKGLRPKITSLPLLPKANEKTV